MTAVPDPSSSPSPVLPSAAAPSSLALLPPTRRELLGRLCLAAILNVFVALVVSRELAVLALTGATALGVVAVGCAWLATLVSLVVAPLVLTSLPLLALPRRWLLVVVMVGVFGLWQVLLLGDVVIYQLFRMHYNLMVWDLITTPAGADSLTLGRGTIISSILAIIGIMVAEAVIAWLTLRPAATRFVSKRWLLSALAAVILVVVADKVVYAVGDLANRTDITRIERYFPLYQRVTIRRFAFHRGWVGPREDGAVLRVGESGLNYPRAEIPLPAEPKRLNIVVLAIEGCRSDMLTPAVMPNLHAFAQTHTWGRNHFSGGNATRFGIFSLFYGIHAAYWQQVLAERHGPYLFTALKGLGYDLTIQSCTDLNFPEFRKTAFVDVQSAITDQWPEIPRVERDRAMTDNLLRTISTAGDRPFFAFGFYDASHSSYIYPPEHEVFTPVQLEQSIDFIEIAGHSTVENLRPLANRYRNALHYVDAQVARVLSELERRGLLDRTMVFITGDHGQEFGELGYYGHNGSFNRYQTQTAFVAHIPGLAPGPIERFTSHIDVVPTILANLGVSAPISDYAQGQRLDRPSDRDHVVTVGWDSLGLIDSDVIMIRGTDTYNLTRELFDRDYRELPSAAAAMSKRSSWMPQLIQELGAFRR
jgi:uncharacterized protein